MDTDVSARLNRIWLCLGLAVIAAGASVPAMAADSLALTVKAAFVYKFAPFVTWPPDAQSRPQFTICLVGDDRFGGMVEAGVASQTYGGRPYVVRHLNMISAGSDCDIAYIAGSRVQPVSAALTAVRDDPILTITDEGAPEGVISFRMQAGHVRFRIDETAAAARGLDISSELLGLATAVKTDKGVIVP